jgi:hypothetical protein
MRYEKKYKLLQEVYVTGYYETKIIVSTMEYSNPNHYLVSGIAKPVHEKDIAPKLKFTTYDH